MKKILIVLPILLLSSCGIGGYSDGQNVISFIKQYGKLKSKIYYYDINFNDSSFIKNYALYDSEISEVGVSIVSESKAWSPAANKAITTYYTLIFGFFEPGKPWEADYSYYHYSVDKKTLVKESWEASFIINKSAFNTNSHGVYINSDYVENIKVVAGDESTINIDEFDLIKPIADTFNFCKEAHMIRNMSYLF